MICPACQGPSHPASGSAWPSGRVVCALCTRRFHDWLVAHGKRKFRVGPKRKNAEYIPFPSRVER